MNPDTKEAHSTYALKLVESERMRLYEDAEDLREELDSNKRYLQDALLEADRLRKVIENLCDHIDVLDAQRLSLLDAGIALKKEQV